MNLDRIVSNQPQYNMIQRKIEGEVIPLCEREGVGQVVFSPLAQGVLTGKYRPGDAPEEGTRAADPEYNRFMQQLMNEEVLSRWMGCAPSPRTPASACRSSRSRGCCARRT